ncbi:amidase [bacterium]|nr:amidase [bacterium]
MIPADWAFATIGELGAKLRAKETTSIALTEFFLERLERIGRAHNAVVTLTRELALAQAQQADADFAAGIDHGPLHGIPYGAKDLLATAGIPTSWGAAPFRDQVFDTDATVITRLRKAGAVLVAKLAMIELAGGFGYRQAHASFTGPALCAWDKTRWGGGSSSGSGIAVGAGLVPFAIGSETSGSILNPSAANGVTGFRPTYGRVPRTGAMALSWTLDKLGPMCRCADDCALVLPVLAGPDAVDFTAMPEGYQFTKSIIADKTLKVGIVEGCLDNVQPEVKSRFEAACDVFRDFATVETVALPELPYGPVVSTIINGEMAAAFESFITSGKVQELSAPEDKWGGYSVLAVPAKDYINALRVRRPIQLAIDQLMRETPILIAPTMATVAGPIDRDFRSWSRGFSSSPLGTAGNAAGLPGMGIPMGPGADGLPTSLQIVAGARQESLLLSVAMEYQQRTAWHREHPPQQ